MLYLLKNTIKHTINFNLRCVKLEITILLIYNWYFFSTIIGRRHIYTGISIENEITKNDLSNYYVFIFKYKFNFNININSRYSFYKNKNYSVPIYSYFL